ncbi:F0F1 ATP synthase subunit epsilon [uncultured Mailhella sp.]|uniref:F0F1 ATP synthase subunit epsilon n=1 Tax=uncultured Mailhella sp. TaxID=1981031 RepID=UPI0025CC3698|nr:F0F1 ATP synthase subunit epsilon [uncultured Mailhella sp.]
MEGLRLDIVTPDKVVLQEEVDYVGASGVDGEFGVMPGHAAMLSALKIGDLYYRKGGVTSWVFVSGGFAQIADNKVTILAEAAELASDIDVDRAEQAKARAEARLADPKPDTDVHRAELALTRAIERIRVARR